MRKREISDESVTCMCIFSVQELQHVYIQYNTGIQIRCAQVPSFIKVIEQKKKSNYVDIFTIKGLMK